MTKSFEKFHFKFFAKITLSKKKDFLIQRDKTRVKIQKKNFFKNAFWRGVCMLLWFVCCMRLSKITTDIFPACVWEFFCFPEKMASFFDQTVQVIFSNAYNLFSLTRNNFSEIN